MPKIGLFNIAFGFLVIFFAAAAGAFLAVDITDYMNHDKELLNSWLHILKQSAHGHTNLFGMLHILFGLTLPYSVLSHKYKTLQTYGLAAGTLSMSLGLLIQGWLGPKTSTFDLMGLGLGLGLSLALIALFTHSAAIFYKLNR